MLHGTTPLLQYKILKNREKTQPIQYNKCSFYTVPYYSYLVNGKNKQRGRPPEKRPSPACLVFVGLVVVNLQIGSAGAADNGPGRRFAMLGLALNFRDRRLVIGGCVSVQSGRAIPCLAMGSPPSILPGYGPVIPSMAGFGWDIPMAEDRQALTRIWSNS